MKSTLVFEVENWDWLEHLSLAIVQSGKGR